MFRRMLKSKIHRARVTHADVNYEGSITIPPHLLELADILPFEAVQVWNVSAGTRFETYAICGEIDSTFICVNGAAAHLVTPGDIIIIATFVNCLDDNCRDYQPIAVFVDEHNQVKEIRSEVAAHLEA